MRNKRIMTLQTIFEQLKSGNTNYFKLLYNYNNSDWILYAKYNMYIYQPRIIYKDNMTNVKLITWLPSQGTEVHGHPEYNQCYFKILKGKLNEDLYDRNTFNLFKTKKYVYNDIGYCHDSYVHRIINMENTEPAVSLHIYSLNSKDNLNNLWFENEKSKVDLIKKYL